MSKRKLFEDFDAAEDGPSSTLRVNENYAIAYDNWREKEELQKLKDRYGDVSLADEVEISESSDEDENPFEDLTPAEERDFFKKLSILKSGHYKRTLITSIDDSEDDAKISTPRNSSASAKKSKKRKEKPMYLKDYERQLILERDGRLSDSDEDNTNGPSMKKAKTYVEEQEEIKKSFKSALQDDDDENGDFLRTRKKTADEQAREEEEYLQWLKGQKEAVADEKLINDLKPLRDYWTDPNLDEGERFLRDYILNRRYIDGEDETENDERIPSYDEIIGQGDVNIEEDEEELDRQEEFEHKYNFRFEEPDAEFLKTYPRTVAESLRRKEDKRKLKRDELKKRKEEGKKKQIEEVKQLKNLKRKEIMDKLERLRRTAGVDQLPLKLEELDDDFDPEKYDKAMQAAFGDGYYATNDEEKPEFSEDEEIDQTSDVGDGDLANWDDWTTQSVENEETSANEVIDDKPGPSHRNQDNKLSGKKRKLAQSLLAQALKKKKPIFDPGEKKFEQYLDEYYKLDFEDVIGGDVRCRFKYREVQPNDFGLSVDEILTAKDKELNAWVSVKKMSQYRSKDEETYDHKAYRDKSRDLSKKQRLLHSVYGEKLDDDSQIPTSNIASDKEKSQTQLGSIAMNKKKRKKKKKVKDQQKIDIQDATVIQNQSKRGNSKIAKMREKKNFVERLSNDRLAAYGVNAKKLKNRFKYSKKFQ